MVLRFTVPGKPVSNNRTTRRFGNRSVKSAEASNYQRRVFSCAFAAVMGYPEHEGWEPPEACSVQIDAYNVRLDVGNIEKNVCDGMQGVVFHDDKVVTKLIVEKHKDLAGERLVVTVERRDPLVKPKKKKAA